MKPRFGLFSILLSPGYFLWVANVVLVIGLSILGFIAHSSLSADALSRARDEAGRELSRQNDMGDAARCDFLEREANSFTPEVNNGLFVLADKSEAARLVSEAPDTETAGNPGEFLFDGRPVAGIGILFN